MLDDPDIKGRFVDIPAKPAEIKFDKNQLTTNRGTKQIILME